MSFLSPQALRSLEAMEHSAIKTWRGTWIFKINETEIGMHGIQDIIKKSLQPSAQIEGSVFG